MDQIIQDYTFTSESRAFCPSCEFLKSRCLCDTLKSIPNHLHLVILQHPSESKHPLNTVRIMKKSFVKLSVFVGEDFGQNLGLNEILSNPNHSCALLYPTEEARVLSESDKKLTHLFLIDGTWRKAKKIFLLSKNLQELPAIKLDSVEASNYRLRKAPNEHALSTLEAAVIALNILEPGLDTRAAKISFDKMIDIQIKKMGREIYKNNYLDKKH